MLGAAWLAFTTFAKGPLLAFLKLVWSWLQVMVPAWALALTLALGFVWHVRHQDAAVTAAVAKSEVKCAKAFADAETLAKADYAKELRAVAVVGAKMVSAILDAATQREKVKVVTRTIVQEVAHAVDQSPELAGCRVPADVVRLRHDQVAQSAAAATPAH